MANLVDVWDAETFDEGLMAPLRSNADLVRSYIAADKDISIQREASRGRLVYQSNAYADRYHHFLENLGRQMELSTIRAWHYTRLTESEVDALKTTGLYLSTVETTRERLDAQVTDGQISVEIANALFEASPLRDRQQADSRVNRFWMTSQPTAVDDDDVTLLLNNWGGEVVYFWLQDEYLERVVGGIGQPRVLELAVPLSATEHGYRAARAVLATFARSLGCDTSYESFDLCAIRPLGPEAVLAVHTEGEATFERIGKGYPTSFHPSVNT
ncbi:MAG TPA: hypothetical protein VMD91_10590 [Candidatus Sulfotelmatobacter sp.]|nr:hypothetical protein [Candidatus Sulfotelmatobacter sp.]